jgi:D-alanyl-D-alanine carboxypeptidase
MAAWCRELAIPAAVLAALVTAESHGHDTYASLAADADVPPIATDMTSSVKLPDAAIDVPAVAALDVPTASAVVDAPATADTDHTPAAGGPVLAALEQPAAAENVPQIQIDASPQTSVGPTADDIDGAIGSAEVADECLVIDTCVDRYLWQLYQRTPKEDSVREETRRQVTIKRKGRMVTVTRTSTTVTDEDFGWKDSKAANKAGMNLKQYAIGGVDRDFKLRLFQMLHAAEDAGLVPGITSGFRDDYRQSIASGLKAANDRSYHGGSSHGGYGHGLAADVVSVKGATRAERLNSSQLLWKWVDDHGSEFGLGRPYLGRDPPHVAPNDGEEYAHHRGGAKTRQATTAPHSAKHAAL